MSRAAAQMQMIVFMNFASPFSLQLRLSSREDKQEIAPNVCFLALAFRASEHSARMSQMLKSSGATAIATMVSRVLGLVREIFYARFMGVGLVTDAFMMAFQIPNLFRRLLGEGALTASFIPIFKEKE